MISERVDTAIHKVLCSNSFLSKTHPSLRILVLWIMSTRFHRPMALVSVTVVNRRLRQNRFILLAEPSPVMKL